MTLFADGSILGNRQRQRSRCGRAEFTLHAGYLSNAGSIGDVSNDLEIDSNRSGVDTDARLHATATRAIYVTELPGSLLIGTIRSTGAGLIRLTLPDTAALTRFDTR